MGNADEGHFRLELSSYDHRLLTVHPSAISRRFFVITKCLNHRTCTSDAEILRGSFLTTRDLALEPHRDWCDFGLQATP